MSREIMISLLRKGNTGAQILEILDSIVADTDNTETNKMTAEPTLHELEFWSHKALISHSIVTIPVNNE